MRAADMTAELVSGLIADQFPEWAGLPVRPVEAGGIDNRTFRLGQTMSVRLPADAACTTGVIEAVMADHLAASA